MGGSYLRRMRWIIFILVLLTLCLMFFWQSFSNSNGHMSRFFDADGLVHLFHSSKSKFGIIAEDSEYQVIKTVLEKEEALEKSLISNGLSLQIETKPAAQILRRQIYSEALKRIISSSSKTGVLSKRNERDLTQTSPLSPTTRQVTPMKKDDTLVIPKKACEIPKLNAFDESALEYVEDVGEYKCDRTDRGILDNGVLRIRAFGIRDAFIRYIRRAVNDDFKTNLSKPIRLFKQDGNTTPIRPGLVGCLVNFDGKQVGINRKLSERIQDPINLFVTESCNPENYIRILENGQLQDFAKEKCLIPAGYDSNDIEFEDCDLDTTYYQLLPNGIILHTSTKKCISLQEEQGTQPMISFTEDCDNGSNNFWVFKDFPSTRDIDTEITVTEDFVELQIADERAINTELYAEVRPKMRPSLADLNQRKLGLPYSVAFLVIDSQSAANVERKLKRTFNYLNEDNNTVLLKGHTINGDGTTAQLCAILVGATEEHLPEARRGHLHSESVDRWPFLFKNFSHHNYTTLFSEDESSFGAFHYRLHGFEQQPTDHYARSFWSRLPRGRHGRFCMGSKMIHQVGLNYTMSFLNAYKKQLKFSFTVFSELFHNELNIVQYADQDILNFIIEFKRSGHSADTILFLVSDHGLRVSKFRETIQGKLEERLPFAAVMLPPSLAKQHPHFVSALKHNSKLLTTNYDTHVTLKHILSYPLAPKHDLGQSLFTNIDSSKRSCENSGIKDHWCPCLQFSETTVSDKNVVDAAKAIVKFINENIIGIIDEASGRCSKLELFTVKRAGLKLPQEAVQNFVRTSQNWECDECGVVSEKKAIERQESNEYEIVLSVRPGGGLFEAKAMKNGSSWIVDKDISRINLYGNQPSCIKDEFPSLVKYCFCK